VLPDAQVQRIIGLVGQPCPDDPLAPEDEAAADAALSSDAGKQAVDALDGKRLTIVCGYLDQAVRLPRTRSKARRSLASACGAT
jgi:hypothetical protein